MPRTVTEYQCLIISPSDVAQERTAVVDVIQRWNASVGRTTSVRVEPVLWETHTHPDLSGVPQGIINEQIVDDCDFGIAIFWGRVGTPTADHASGSVEEVERLARRGAKVMMYQSSRPIPPEQINTEQLERLRAIFDDFQNRGLLSRFSSIAELREQVSKDLTLLLRRQLHHTAPDDGEAAVLTAKRLDVRVKTEVAITDTPDGVASVFAIKVENHSPQTIFLSSITHGSLILSSGFEEC